MEVHVKGKESTRLEARNRAENDLWFLATEILQYGFLYPRVHKRLCQWAQAADCTFEEWRGEIGINRTRMVLWPRDHGKTTVANVADNIRLQLKYPGICTAIGHDSKEVARPMLAQIREEFESKKLLKWIAPDICWVNPRRDAPKWDQDHLYLRRKNFYRVPSFCAVSTDSLPLSFHFDVWTWDDLVTEDNSRTHFQRNRVKTAYRVTHPFMSMEGLRLIKICGTRWHLDDLYGELEKEIKGLGKPEDLMISGMLDDEGVPWFDKKFCVKKDGPEDRRETLDEVRTRMTPYIFSACMMQNPLPEGTQKLDAALVNRYECFGQGRSGWRPPLQGRNWQFYTAVDLNTLSPTAQDDACVLAVALSDDGHVCVVDINLGKPSRYQMLEWVFRQNEDWAPAQVFVETVAFQQTFIQDLVRTAAEKKAYLPTVAVKRGGVRSGSGKNDRIMCLQGTVEAKKLWVPQDSRFERLMQELRDFTPDADSAHDDALDCLADCFRYGRKPTASDPRLPEPAPEALLTAHIMGREPTLVPMNGRFGNEWGDCMESGGY